MRCTRCVHLYMYVSLEFMYNVQSCTVTCMLDLSMELTQSKSNITSLCSNA